MLGGITTSIAPIEVSSPAENAAGYLARFSAGSMAPPMVATEAALSPLMAPNSADEQIVVTPSPPGMRPTPALTRSTRRPRHRAAAHQLAGQDEERDGEQV